MTDVSECYSTTFVVDKMYFILVCCFCWTISRQLGYALNTLMNHDWKVDLKKDFAAGTSKYQPTTWVRVHVQELSVQDRVRLKTDLSASPVSSATKTASKKEMLYESC